MMKQLCLYIIFFLSLFALQTNAADKNLKILEILQISTDPEVQSTVLFADKVARRLYVFSKNSDLTTAQEYEIDIGKSDGNKTKRDDHKTPEGIYVLEQKKLPPEIPFDLYGSMAFTTNYPNVFDKFENKSGDGIWLHSVPDKVPLTRGSRGCVVVRNDNIKLIDPEIEPNKSFLIINDKARWVPADEHEKEKTKVLEFLSSWKNLWQEQNLDSYINLYSDNFSAPNFNKKSWLTHKQNLKGKYKFVKIDLGSASIFHQKNQYLIRLVQNYESDGHKDTGLKTLYVIEDNNKLQILREEWAPLKKLVKN